MQLNPNLNLPQGHGPFTDSQYLADEAALRAQVSQRYNDILKQLGYSDPTTGKFVMGSVENNANIQRAQYAHDLAMEEQGVTHDALRNGILFSGMRGTLQAQAQDPTVRQQSQLEYQLPLTLSDLFEQAQTDVSDYTIGQNQLMGQAAQRAAQAAEMQALIDALNRGSGSGAPPPPQLSTIAQPLYTGRPATDSGGYTPTAPQNQNLQSLFAISSPAYSHKPLFPQTGSPYHPRTLG
jgi:hypothetical protein